MIRAILLTTVTALAACGRQSAHEEANAAAVVNQPFAGKSADLRMGAPVPTAAPAAPAIAGGVAAPLFQFQVQRQPLVSDYVTAVTSRAVLLRSGQISIEVRSVDSASARVRAAATAVGGYVTDVGTEAGHNEIPSATLTVKVPPQRYDDLMRALQAIGTVESSRTSVADVGEEYVDITARVANDRRLEQRLVALLENRTGKLQDVLNVERELARVRGEIDSYEARIRYFDARAATSTVVVTVHAPMPLVADAGARSPIALAFTQARRNFVETIAWVIAALGMVVPVSALLAVAWAAFRYRRTWLRTA